MTSKVTAPTRSAIDLPPGAFEIGLVERLGQIFLNLIDNAVSFSGAGQTVTVAAVAEGRFARVTVEDEGPGIPPDNLESIFGRFYTERPAEHGFGFNSGPRPPHRPPDRRGPRRPHLGRKPPRPRRPLRGGIAARGGLNNMRKFSTIL